MLKHSDTACFIGESLPPQLSETVSQGRYTEERNAEPPDASSSTQLAYCIHLQTVCDTLGNPMYPALSRELHKSDWMLTEYIRTLKLVTHPTQCWTLKDKVNFIARLTRWHKLQNQSLQVIPSTPNILRQVMAAHSESEYSLHTSVCKARLKIVL